MIRVACWSGPRNISTAMMRAWENRPDTQVVDEPLYAYYLARTGSPHPGRDAVIAAGETDWRKVLQALEQPLPAGVDIRYEKHMTHHLLPEVELERLAGCRHVFLIRHPAEVLRSYARKRQQVVAEDLGFARQGEIFAWVRRRTGAVPPVIDAAAVLRDPRAVLTSLCAALELPFDERMLSWPAGPRASDGIWAKHWYDAVWSSTGFRPWQPREEALPPELAAMVEQCLPAYQCLAAHAL